MFHFPLPSPQVLFHLMARPSSNVLLSKVCFRSMARSPGALVQPVKIVSDPNQNKSGIKQNQRIPETLPGPTPKWAARMRSENPAFGINAAGLPRNEVRRTLSSCSG
jgi:hypothetical protein